MLSSASSYSDNNCLDTSFASQQRDNPVVFPVNIQTNLSFHNNQDFVIQVEASEERLSILVEDRFDVNMWKGDFTSKYIEEICRKTGRERSYSMFVQMISSALQNAKGSSQFYIDLLAFEDLQLLKARRTYSDENLNQNQQLPGASGNSKSNKRYLIITNIARGQDSKVHFPLPLNPVDTNSLNLDKETMKSMVKRMSQTLTDFKQMSLTGGSVSQQSNTQASGFGNFTNQGRQTAKEFFSRENMTHPVVEENSSLRQELRQLEEVRQMGGAVSANSLNLEKRKVEQEYQSFKNITQEEIKNLKRIKAQLASQISDTKSEIQSERPQSSYSQSQNYSNTMSSGFNQTNVSELEEIRRRLAEASVELEEEREQYKKKLALQQKDMEEYYQDLGTLKNEDKALRVRVNQIENDLDHHIKRLDIICKSKGLARPQRKNQTSNRYVSPYRQSPANRDNIRPQFRNLSNGSTGQKASPFRNLNYTPPNRRGPGYSPSNLSNNSANTRLRNTSNSRYSPNITKFSNRNSPGNKSNGSVNSTSKKSTGSQNRLYSPSGRIRQGISNLHGTGSTGVNRVRREPAVGGSQLANSRSNSRQRSNQGTPPSSNLQKTSYSNNGGSQRRNQPKAGPRVYTNSGVNSNKERSSLTRASNTTSTANKPQANTYNAQKKTLFSSSNQPQPSQVLSQQRANVNGTIDEKIEKLQSLLKMAKNPNI